jgi:hypothetical protein
VNKTESDSRGTSRAGRIHVARALFFFGDGRNASALRYGGHAGSLWVWFLPLLRPAGIVIAVVHVGRPLCSQGGVQVPTGGKVQFALAQARERLPLTRKGQQIRCESEADGIVRMKENGSRSPRFARGLSFRMP